MKKIAVIGECMVEFYQDKKGIYKQTFGGDTFNFSVYLKRSFQKASVEYITILGKDIFSKKMFSFFKKEDVKTSFIEKRDDRNTGLYIISTEDGERSFSYWRNNSASKLLFTTPYLKTLQKQLQKVDLIYFSAITLAIMSNDGRENFFKILKKARKNGIKIAFDSNYRKKLYSSMKEAKNIYDKALAHSDIFLPSFDDDKELWGNLTTKDIINKSIKYGCLEIVIKCGADDIVYCNNLITKKIKNKKIKKIIDSTSAGDSFNAGYLASRLKGKDVKSSIKKAQNLASKVIMHKGAIIKKDI